MTGTKLPLKRIGMGWRLLHMDQVRVEFPVDFIGKRRTMKVFRFIARVIDTVLCLQKLIIPFRIQHPRPRRHRALCGTF